MTIIRVPSVQTWETDCVYFGGVGVIPVSRCFAEQFVSPGIRYVLISITDPDSEPARLQADGCRDGVLRLAFDDWNDAQVASLPAHVLAVHPPMDEDDAWQVARFVHEHKGVPLWVVHCEAGVSRSAGVALAILHWLGSTAQRQWPHTCPNRLCYRLVSEALKRPVVQPTLAMEPGR